MVDVKGSSGYVYLSRANLHIFRQLLNLATNYIYVMTSPKSKVEKDICIYSKLYLCVNIVVYMHLSNFKQNIMMIL